jgi:hypothetical protein
VTCGELMLLFQCAPKKARWVRCCTHCAHCTATFPRPVFTKARPAALAKASRKRLRVETLEENDGSKRKFICTKVTVTVKGHLAQSSSLISTRSGNSPSLRYPRTH